MSLCKSILASFKRDAVFVDPFSGMVTGDASQARYLVMPGLHDVHVHFRDPGTPEAETRQTGALAAVSGGFTCVTTMPNTSPAGDNVPWLREQLEDVSLPVRIAPSACITRGRRGKEVADLERLAEAGAVAFTDDGTYVADAHVMEEAMCRAARLGIPVMQHAVDPELLHKGVIRDCPFACACELPIMPPEAEIEAVKRDIALVRVTGCALHVQHISCAQTVELIRAAQQEGLSVTGEVTPHHLLLSCDAIVSDDPDWKMAPPLGSRLDRAALRAGVLDGTIGIMATDHAPHTAHSKSFGFLRSANGIVGLETAVAVTYQALVQEAGMNLLDWVRCWTSTPAKLIGEAIEGDWQDREYTVIDRQARRRVDVAKMRTRARNTPFKGMRFDAWPVLTVREGKVVFDGREII